jgi:hypothetical protein
LINHGPNLFPIPSFTEILDNLSIDALRPVILLLEIVHLLNTPVEILCCRLSTFMRARLFNLERIYVLLFLFYVELLLSRRLFHGNR